MKEVYKHIPGYDNKYSISNYGNVINKKGKLLKVAKGSNCVTLFKSKTQPEKISIRVLVLENFNLNEQFLFKTPYSTIGEWRDIKGYEGIYKINKYGDVISLTRLIVSSFGKVVLNEVLLKPLANHKGYFQVVLSKNGKSKTKTVHRLVAETFVPNPDNKETVNHIDGVKTNNNVENLEWCTNQENIIHAHKNNLTNPCKGESNSSAKLKEQDVHLIRKVHKDGESIRKISKRYEMCESTISQIVNRKSWKHI